jgi:tetratricopeptide (TPR) repeat protein
MHKIMNLFLFLLICTLSIYSHAEGESETVTTSLQIYVDSKKAASLRPQLSELVEMVNVKRFAVADQRAAELRKAYEATFDTRVKQYSFQSQAEFQEFNQSSTTKFEWIDWGYKECLQMQAFIASERRDFAAAFAILKTIELVAPVSAGTATETGYVLNQLGKPDEGLSAYRRAYALSVKYPSQRPFRAVALRGIGYSLIDLKRLDEAERAFRKSLEIEPENNIALSELAYIRDLQGLK